ncbi:vacuolar protein sorting 55 superfamily protein [Neoconidiobolus thromboides FSU 785]|nr:vacuolar protein sorting 55 superfamily protein [Neoconidiobolus thromboides FSU 785]
MGFFIAIVSLAFVLAVGFLLSILACALYGNWLPLIVVFIYLFAAIPNPLCQRCSNINEDILSDNNNNGFSDAGKFLTSVFVVSGFGLPLVLSHSNLIEPMAATLSISGGLLIYASILLYAYFFNEEESF